jgi:hypothetical protein
LILLVLGIASCDDFVSLLVLLLAVTLVHVPTDIITQEKRYGHVGYIPVYQPNKNMKQQQQQLTAAVCEFGLPSCKRLHALRRW